MARLNQKELGSNSLGTLSIRPKVINHNIKDIRNQTKYIKTQINAANNKIVHQKAHLENLFFLTLFLLSLFF